MYSSWHTESVSYVLPGVFWSYRPLPSQTLLILSVKYIWMLRLYALSILFFYLCSLLATISPKQSGLQLQPECWWYPNLHFQPVLFPYFSSAFSTAGWISDGISNQHVHRWIILFWLNPGSSITIFYIRDCFRPPALMPVVIHLVTKSCQFHIHNVCNPFSLFGPHYRTN